MWLHAIFLVSSFLFANARTFNNPILLDGDTPDPGTIKVDGVYYIVTTTNDNTTNKFPIHTSTDLQNWTLSGYAFTAENFPKWTIVDRAFWAPEIHRVGNEFRLYYTSMQNPTAQLAIGVASAPHPAGPYQDIGQALFLDPTGHANIDPTLINDNGTLYLIWKNHTGGWIKGRPLSPDGLSFAPDSNMTQIFTTTLPWEDVIVEGPWHVRRGQYHYIFYSGHPVCSTEYKVGIARALHPLGPYEKRGPPILESNELLKGPGHNSVVKDLDDENDLIVFHAYRKGQVCDPWPRLTSLASIGWGEDDWPYTYDWQ